MSDQHEALVETVARVICKMWMDPDRRLPNGYAWEYYIDGAEEVLKALPLTVWNENMDEAPRNGTKVDLWGPACGRIADAYWNCKEACWDKNWDRIIFSITHWTPLPPAPDKGGET